MVYVLRDRLPWFDLRYSYNPAVHRLKQSLFHAAVVTDLRTNPVPPPHPEVTKYLDPPRRVLKHANDAIEDCKKKFKVKAGECRHCFPIRKCLSRLRCCASPEESRAAEERRTCPRRR